MENNEIHTATEIKLFKREIHTFTQITLREQRNTYIQRLNLAKRELHAYLADMKLREES